MTFRIYDSATADINSPLWIETKNVVVSKGLFSTLLGDTAALPATTFDGNDRWLGVLVGADAETTPQAWPVPYASWAINAGNAAGLLDGRKAHFIAM